MKHVLMRHRTPVAHLIRDRIWLYPNVVIAHNPTLFLHTYCETMRNQKQLFRYANFSIPFLVLRAQSESAGTLLDLAALMFAFATPVGVANVDPHTAVIGENWSTEIEGFNQLPNEILRVVLQPDLSFHLIVALSV